MCVNVKNKPFQMSFWFHYRHKGKAYDIGYELTEVQKLMLYGLLCFTLLALSQKEKNIYNQALNFWQVYIKNFSTIYLWLPRHSGLPLSEHLNKSLVVQFMYSPYWYWVPFTCLLYVLFCQCQFSHWSFCHKTISHHSLSELCPFCPR